MSRVTKETKIRASNYTKSEDGMDNGFYYSVVVEAKDVDMPKGVQELVNDFQRKIEEILTTENAPEYGE